MMYVTLETHYGRIKTKQHRMDFVRQWCAEVEITAVFVVVWYGSSICGEEYRVNDLAIRTEETNQLQDR